MPTSAHSIALKSANFVADHWEGIRPSLFVLVTVVYAIALYVLNGSGYTTVASIVSIGATFLMALLTKPSNELGQNFFVTLTALQLLFFPWGSSQNSLAGRILNIRI